MPRPRALDLFAGCGGLSMGLEEAGFQVAWANEIDPAAAATYANSNPEAKIWVEDASQFLLRCESRETGCPVWGEVDLLAGGPPCQGFSGYNRYRGPEDPRNSLVEVYLDFVKLLLPRYVLMENVPGMLQMEAGSTPRLLMAALEDLGYSVGLGILQAGHYGLPQNRWRVFILASLVGECRASFPVPTHFFPRITIHGATAFRNSVVQVLRDESSLFGSLLPASTVGDAIQGLPMLRNGQLLGSASYGAESSSDYDKLMRLGSTNVDDHECLKQGPIMMERIEAVPRKEGAGWLDLPDHLKPKNLVRHGDDRYKNRFGRLWWSGIFNTIVSIPYPYWGRFIHPEQDRVLSVRECARAQGIPDRVRFAGNQKSKYRQVGNAVPPPLAAAVGREILRAMRGKES